MGGASAPRTPLPPTAMPPEFMQNGTFMAYRKLHENVASFHEVVDAEAAQYAETMGVDLRKFQRDASERGAPFGRRSEHHHARIEAGDAAVAAQPGGFAAFLAGVGTGGEGGGVGASGCGFGF